MIELGLKPKKYSSYKELLEKLQIIILTVNIMLIKLIKKVIQI